MINEELIGEKLNDISEILKIISSQLTDIANNSLSTLSDLIGSISGAIEIISTMICLKILPKIGELIGFIAAKAGSLNEIFNVVFGTVGTVISGIVTIIVGAVTSIVNFIDMLKNGFNWLKEIFMLLGIAIAAVGAVILGAPAAIAAAVAAVVGLIATAIIVIKNYGLDILNFIINLFKNMCNILTEAVILIVEVISTAFNDIKQFFIDLINKIVVVWNEFWVNLFTKVNEITTNIAMTISTWIENVIITISKVLDRLKTTWNKVWETFSDTISNVWNEILNTIKNIINSILGGIESMANGIVTGINKVIGVLNNLEVSIPDWVPLFGGKKIGFNIKEMNTVSLPRLAKGNVAYSPMVAMFGEYSGARSNPEITTPQNIMAETFNDVLSNHELTSGGNSPIQLAVYVGNKKLGDILLDNLRDIRRQTGSNIEAIVGG